MQRKPTSRRAVMKAFGEYVDFAAWLAQARNGVDVDPEDPPSHEIAPMVKAAHSRFEDKLENYLSDIADEGLK